MPFSRAYDAGEVDTYAEMLRQSLDLNCRVAVIALEHESALALESAIRMRWWHTGEDQLRARLHDRAQTMFAAVAMRGLQDDLTAAWRDADTLGHSAIWRKQLAAQCRRHEPWTPFLRLAFRAAQQTLTRAARTSAIMGAECAAPLFLMLELFARSAWPVGTMDDTLFVITMGDRHHVADAMQTRVNESSRRARTVFISSNSRDLAAKERVRKQLEVLDWNIVDGWRNELGEPIEHVLARDIATASAVVALHDRIDPDFGRSWWMQQEMEFAIACGTPVVRVGRACVRPDALSWLPTIDLETFEKRGDKWYSDSFGNR